MSPRNIDNITNITLEKCSWELVIYSICTLESCKQKQAVNKKSVKQVTLSLGVCYSWQAEIPCWAEQECSMKKSNLLTKCHQKYSKLKEGGQQHPSMMGIIHSSSSLSKTIEEGTGISSKKRCCYIFGNNHSVDLPLNSGDKVFWYTRDWLWLRNT